MNSSKKIRGSRFWSVWLISGALGTVKDGVPVRIPAPRKKKPAREISAYADQPTPPEGLVAARALPSRPHIAFGGHGSWEASSYQTILVWHENQRTPATLFGLARFGVDRFFVEVCRDPNRRLTELGPNKAIIYHHF